MVDERRVPVIIAVRPTVFFVKDGNGLKQMVDMEVESPTTVQGVALRTVFGANKVDIPLGDIPRGKTTYNVPIPDIRDAVHVRFSLMKGVDILASKELVWKPGKHWKPAWAAAYSMISRCGLLPRCPQCKRLAVMSWCAFSNP